MTLVASRIKAAVEATKRLVPGYFEATCASRGAEKPCGSVVLQNGELAHDVSKLLFDELIDRWTEYADCPNLMEGTTAYKLSAPGIGALGVIELVQLPPSDLVVLDDRKNTGKVSCVVKGLRGQVVDFIVCIIGSEQGEDVIFTFHPGDPVQPSKVQAEPGLHGKTVTALEAYEMGLRTAKIE